MKKTLAIVLLVPGMALAQANSESASNAGSIAQTGSITFEASSPADRVHTTAPVYLPPAMFGQGSCGRSNSVGGSVTGIAAGVAWSTDDEACDARADTQTAWNLGYKEVAAVRFFCFGTEANKKAFLALGNKCPEEVRTVSTAYQGNDPIIRQRLGME